LQSIKILNEYERGVILRLGKALGKPKGPGLIIVLPFIDKLIKVDLRTITMDVPPQDIITKDNISVKVNAVVYLRVIDPLKAVIEVEDYIYATSQLAQTTLRSVLGQSELDEILSHRDKINMKLQSILDAQTDPWGVKVSVVEIKSVDLPEQMIRAISRQAEAEREKRAKIIHAEGELQSSKTLLEAAKVLSNEPITLQLRYLQAIGEMATERTTFVFFPLPMEFVEALKTFSNSHKTQEKHSS
jgi:regulator of protease activity HflC (stomatin/prohibitin superfamily)